LAVELLENRLLPAGDLLFQATESVAVTLRLSEGTVQIADSSEPSTVLASKPLNEITAGVRIEGNTFDVHLTIDAQFWDNDFEEIPYSSTSGTIRIVPAGSRNAIPEPSTFLSSRFSSWAQRCTCGGSCQNATAPHAYGGHTVSQAITARPGCPPRRFLLFLCRSTGCGGP
jgi:hypothetical protein